MPASCGDSLSKQAAFRVYGSSYRTERVGFDVPVEVIIDSTSKSNITQWHGDWLCPQWNVRLIDDSIQLPKKLYFPHIDATSYSVGGEMQEEEHV